MPHFENINRNNKRLSHELYEVLPFSMFSHSDIPFSNSDVDSSGIRERRRHDRDEERSWPSEKRSSQWQRSDNPGPKQDELDWSAAVSSFVQLLLAFVNVVCITKDIILKALRLIFFSCENNPTHTQKNLEGRPRLQQRALCKRRKPANYTNDFDLTDTESIKAYPGKTRTDVENMKRPHLRASDVFSDRPSGREHISENVKSKRDNRIDDAQTNPCCSMTDIHKTIKGNCFSQNCSGIETGTKHLESSNTQADSSTQTKYFTGFILPEESEGSLKDSPVASACKSFKTTKTSKLFPERSDSLLGHNMSSQLREGVLDFLSLKNFDLRQTAADGNRSPRPVTPAERVVTPQFGPSLVPPSKVDQMNSNYQPRYDQGIPHDVFRQGHTPQIYKPSYDQSHHIYQPRQDQVPQIYQPRYDHAPNIYQPGINHFPQSYQIPQIDQFSLVNTPQSYQARPEQLTQNYQPGFNQVLPNPQPIFVLPQQQYRFIQAPQSAQGSDSVTPVEPVKQKKRARFETSCKPSTENSKCRNLKINTTRKSLSFRRNPITDSFLNILSPSRTSSKKAPKARKYPDVFKFIDKYPSSGASTVNNSCDRRQPSESSSSSTQTESDEMPSEESRPSFSDERMKRVISIPLFPHLSSEKSSKALQMRRSGRISHVDDVVDASALLAPNSNVQRFKKPSKRVLNKSLESRISRAMFQNDEIEHKDFISFCNHPQRISSSFQKQDAKKGAGLGQVVQNQMKESAKPPHTSKHKNLKKSEQTSNSFTREQPQKSNKMKLLSHNNLSCNSPSLLTRWRERKLHPQQSSTTGKASPRVSIDGLSGPDSYLQLVRCDFSSKLSDTSASDYLQINKEICQRQGKAQSRKISDNCHCEGQELDRKMNPGITDSELQFAPKLNLGALKS